MGLPKGLIEVGGKPWILVQLEALQRAGQGIGISRVHVVLGHQREAYEKILRPHSSGLEIVTVLNPDPDRGPFSSLQCGLQRALEAADFGGAWVLPVDVPCPARSVWESLEHEAGVRAADAALPVHHGKGGHPVRLSVRFVETLLSISPAAPDARLDHQIHALPASRVARVEVEDERVLANLNTPSDFSRLAV